MLVGRRMHKEVLTVSAEDTLLHAWEVMQRNNIRHLPVLDEGKLVGILTERDLRTYGYSRATERKEERFQAFGDRTVGQVMARSVLTADPLMPIEEAAKLLHDHRIGCLPVVADEELVGILTQTDILVAFIEILGAHEPSSRLEVEIESSPGQLADILNVIKRHNTGVSSIVTTPADDGKHRIVVLRLKTINPQAVVKSLASSGFKVLWPPIGVR